PFFCGEIRMNCRSANACAGPPLLALRRWMICGTGYIGIGHDAHCLSASRQVFVERSFIDLVIEKVNICANVARVLRLRIASILCERVLDEAFFGIPIYASKKMRRILAPERAQRLVPI